MTTPRTVLTVALPPLSVYLRHGAKGVFWLNVVLTALFYLPGLVHAFWVLRRPLTGQGASAGTVRPRTKRAKAKTT